jgi:hypothetical protein
VGDIEGGEVGSVHMDGVAIEKNGELDQKLFLTFDCFWYMLLNDKIFEDRKIYPLLRCRGKGKPFNTQYFS